MQSASFCGVVRGCVRAPAPLTIGRAHHQHLLRASLRSRKAIKQTVCRAREMSSFAKTILYPVEVAHRKLKNAAPAESVFGSVFKLLLPGPLAFSPALLMPLSCLVAASGAIYGPHWLDEIEKLVTGLEVFQNEAVRSFVKQHWAGSYYIRLGVSLFFANIGLLADFIAVPALDLVMGRDLECNDQERVRLLAENRGYRTMLHCFAGLHFLALLVTCHVAGTQDLHPLVFAGLMGSQAAAGGVMLTVVHELVHSRHKGDGALASALLATVGYMHWSLAHLAHHVNVGKHADPATARRGESVYHFVPRSVVGHLQDGCAAEAHRLHARSIPLYSPRNKMVWWAACPLGLAAAVYAAYGPAGAVMLAGQAAGSVLLLEIVNYLEHYGLERGQLGNGRYEKVAAKHSWNCNWLATSAITFRLQRHADHHLCASRPYQLLEDIDTAPQLPASYPAMALLSLLPGMFFDVMHPRLDEYAAQLATATPGSGVTLKQD